ncbi:hypothetical protein HZB00_01085 [Candidatus Woesearchaeota archaeon]|nr:hypothetical protein [Candidatus Woesearchaeota archaeon]
MQKKLVSKDTPLAEITLRKYERPVNLQKRDLIKKICLSVGLLQPGDSRDIIVDIFHVLLESKQPVNAEELQKLVIEYRKKRKLELRGIATSNIRRQVRRLRELFLVEKVKNEYRICENEELHRIFEEKIKKFYIHTIVERVEEYFKLLR